MISEKPNKSPQPAVPLLYHELMIHSPVSNTHKMIQEGSLEISRSASDSDDENLNEPSTKIILKEPPRKEVTPKVSTSNVLHKTIDVQ